MTAPSSNFAYLAYHDARLVALRTQAEQHFASNPTVMLFKLRQFGEVLAQRAAAEVGLYVAPQEGQQQLIARLFDGGAIGATQRTIFHDLRRVGNTAVHEGRGDHREALHQLRMARELGIRLQRSFGNNKKFAPGPFVPPVEPTRAEAPLRDELQGLGDELRDERAPYLRQLRTKSGVWFLDARRARDHPTPLEALYCPAELLDGLKQDIDQADAQLKVETMPYIES